MKVRLLIDSVDYSTSLLETEWQIETNAFGALDSCSFVLDDPSNTLTLTRGKEVIVEDFDDDTLRFFGGVLTRVTGQSKGLGKIWSCKALDWTFILDRAIVSEEYRGKSDEYVIGEAVASPKGIFTTSETDLSDFDVSTHVQEIVANTQFFKFKNDTLRDILDDLAEISGGIWYVDHFKKLHYKPFGVEAHSFWLSDAPDDSTSFPYSGFRISYDITKIVNLVKVEGAFLRQEYADIPEADRIFESNGVDVHTPARYLWVARDGQTRIQVYRNTGSDGTPTWTEQTVGLAGTDELGGATDVLWDPVSRTLEWDTAPPNFANSFRIDADRLRGLIHEEVDQSSIDTFGRTYAHVIKDVTLLSDEQVASKAYAELQERKGEAERVTCRTTKDGITAGQTMYFVNASFSLAKFYLVERVVTQLLGGTVAEYDLVLKAI